MGAIAEGIVAFAQPLIDATDGSIEQMNRALRISQVCWNMAILPEKERQSFLNSLADSTEVDQAELETLQHSVLLPMIRRHEKMFPGLHQRQSIQSPHWEPWLSPTPTASAPEESPKPGRYDPCPCGSGRKYKFCCGRSGG